MLSTRRGAIALKENLTSLTAIADFNLVTHHGGFGPAARTSGRPKATLSRRVAGLERGLGVRLFERGSRTLKLTEEGRALFERTGRLLNELDETVSAAVNRAERPRGRLKISAPLFFSQSAMGKLAAGFMLKYPEVQLEIMTEDRAVDMVKEGYEVVTRVNPASDETLTGRIFLRDRLAMVSRTGQDDNSERLISCDCSQHSLIGTISRERSFKGSSGSVQRKGKNEKTSSPFKNDTSFRQPAQRVVE